MMRILIAEDDPISRDFLFKFLKKYGECDMAIDGFEALDAYLLSVKENNPYDLLCIDIMMPKFDGLKVLKAIRDIEIQRRILLDRRAKIILTTALDKSHIAKNTFEVDYDAYISKPIDTSKLIGIMQNMGLIETNRKGDKL
jgi:two-component system, chemotaxis family, chemotaxis protein CheY